MPQIRLHGLPCVAPDAGRAIALSAREAALLAWLHLEGPTPRARLAGLLWPAGTEAQARANLRQLLARLRRSAGAVITEADGLLTVAADHGVTDESGGALLGGLEFDDLPELAQWLAARRDEATRRLQREGLARGRASLDHGDLDAALAAADALLAAQPESEEGWRLRMEALYLRGDRAAAIAAWDACKDTLRSSFGVTPSAATNELGRFILASPEAPAAPAARPGALPAALRRPPQLVGREGLLAEVARVMALGRSAVVTGPGGIGKSRVLQQVAAAMEPALRLHARPGDAVLPGGLLALLLQSALERFDPVLDEVTRGDVARLLPGSALASSGPGGPAAADLRSALEHRRVMTAVWASLSACQARGLRLLVVDDLQFADDASLAVLQFVLGRWLVQAEEDGAASAQVLLGARAQELSATGQALVALVTGHASGHLFELAPLQAADVHELVSRLPLPEATTRTWGPEGGEALARALHATVGGNPAFVLEALRSLYLDGFAGWTPGAALPVPATLLESVRRRVRRLPDEALQLAQLAAVAQSDFDSALASSAFARPPLAMTPLFVALESAQVFHGTGFSHDLVAEAVRSSLPQALVAPLHRLVADHLGHHGGAPARVAHHLVAAGQARAAAPWLVKAARAARGRWQLTEAAAAYAAAARGYDPRAERESALAAWNDALRCWIELRRFDETRDALAQAWALTQQVHERALLRAREVHHLFNGRQIGEALREAAALVDELSASTDALEAEELVYALRGVCYAVQGGLPAARVLDLCETLRPTVSRAGGEALAGFALARGATLLWDAQPLEAAAELEAAWPTLGEGSDPYLRRAVANQLMRVRQALGDSAGAVEIGQTLLGWLQGSDDDAGFEADVLSLVAMMQVSQGQGARGLASIDRLVARQRVAGEPMHEVYATTIALSLLAVGRHDDAQAWLDRHTQPIGRPGYAMYDLVLALARARLAAARGEPVAPWVERLAAVSPLPAGGLLHRRVALAGLRAEPLADLQALLEELRRRGQSGLLRSVEIAAARAAWAAGDLQAAAAHARAALGLAACVDAWTDEAATLWLTAHDVLLACGAEAEAQAALDEGVRWVEQGAAQWTQAEHRQAWREGHPVHRALLQRAQARAAGWLTQGGPPAAPLARSP